jgi:hypothetical protein
MNFRSSLFTSILFYFVFSFNLFGQKNYVAGYIITNNNDTLKGLINDFNSGRDPRSIQFLNSGSVTVITYSNSIKKI